MRTGVARSLLVTRRLACRAMAAQAATTLPQRKGVVTAFIQRPTDGSVLVVLRSDQVSTYQRMWGAISGGIEGADESPRFRCEQEVSLPPAPATPVLHWHPPHTP